jgi:hypothetical protein
VAPVKSGYQRQSLQLSVTERVYFKLEVPSSDENVVVYLIDAETGGLVAGKNIEGWRNESEAVVFQ